MWTLLLSPRDATEYKTACQMNRISTSRPPAGNIPMVLLVKTEYFPIDVRYFLFINNVVIYTEPQSPPRIKKVGKKETALKLLEKLIFYLAGIPSLIYVRW